MVFVGSHVYAIVAGPVPLPDGTVTPGVVAVGSSGDVEDDIPAAWLSLAR